MLVRSFKNRVLTHPLSLQQKRTAMRKNKYQIWVSLNENLFLHYNSFSDKYILMNKDNHELYENSTPDILEKMNMELFHKLVNADYFVQDDFRETDIIIYKRLSLKTDTTLYHVVINTTLDCNLKCWYCYEHKFKDSILKDKIILSIKKNIELHYKTNPYTTLKVSFFGGEPFMNSTAIEDILSFSKSFCKKNNIRLIADFTTNSILITKKNISFLKGYDCYFQITLDGNREQHNKVKHIKGLDTYQLALNKIYALVKEIPKCRIWVRINYDAITLSHIDEILKDLEVLDRDKVFLIVRKIWQVSSDKIDTLLLLNSIQKIFDRGFVVDCYPLTTNRLCFAERLNQVLFNYDGKIFKCSTIPKFDKQHSMGELDIPTGNVIWDQNKISQITKVMYSMKCQDCGLFGSCYGACNKTLLQYPNQDFCILKEIGMDMREYLMYNFKLSLQSHHTVGVDSTSYSE